MATKLSDDELVSFKELLIANEVYMEALVQTKPKRNRYTKMMLRL